MEAWVLFIEFFKIGLFAVGGGLATLPFLNQLVEKYPWYTASDLANVIAVSESTPGPLGVNMATYTGFTGLGIPGGVIATTGIVLPSLIIILIIARILDQFNKNPYVKAAFVGLRASVVGLIAAAVLGIVQISLFHTGQTEILNMFNWKAIVVFLFLTIFRFRFEKVHPIVFIAIGAGLGIVLGGF
ncbi:MAG: chromate transporter [Clostridia bacterium]|nr:chromate transporter [Clostridia bacterium]